MKRNCKNVSDFMQIFKMGAPKQQKYRIFRLCTQINDFPPNFKKLNLDDDHENRQTLPALMLLTILVYSTATSIHSHDLHENVGSSEEKNNENSGTLANKSFTMFSQCKSNQVFYRIRRFVSITHHSEESCRPGIHVE